MTKKFVFLAMISAVVLTGAALLLAEKMPQQQQNNSETGITLEPLIAYKTLPTEVSLSIGDTVTTYCFENTTQQFTAENYDTRLLFDQNKLQRLFASCSELNSMSTIEEQPSDLSIYGLDAPAVTVTAQYMDGTRHIVKVGNRSPLGDGYYGMADSRAEVFLLLSYDVDSFLSTLYDYRVPELLPLLNGEESEYVAELLELTLQRKAKGELKLSRKPPADGVGAAQVEPLWITAPIQIEADRYLFSELVIKGLFALMRTAPVIVEDLPKDLSSYGLDTPEVLHLRDSQVDVTLHIGKTDNERIYIMRDGVPSVLSIDQSLLTFFNIDYEDIMNRLIWLHNIKDVAHLQVTAAGVTYDLDTTNEAEGKFLLNGMPVDEAASRSLFVSALSAKVEQRLSDDQQPGEMTCELTVVYKDGTKHTLAFFAMNERQMAFARDGAKPEFYCAVQNVKNIVEALTALLKK